uniref:Uncharacterized protein n=1 Tax=Oryza nivara TaxID=4536 RepID=A0A0E0IIV0_ORYNI
MAAGRPTPDGAPSPRVDGGPVRGGKADDAAWRRRIRCRRGRIQPPRDWIRRIHAGSGWSKPSGAYDRSGGGGGWRLEAGACGGRGGDGEAMVTEAAKDGARVGAAGGRRARRPRTAMRPEAAEAGARGGAAGGWRAWRRWRPAAEAAVAAAAEARPMTADGDVAQPATGDGCTVRRSGRGRW